jgi:hypothetical protein
MRKPRPIPVDQSFFASVLFTKKVLTFLLADRAMPVAEAGG